MVNGPHGRIVNGPHGRMVPTGEARLLVTVGLILGAIFQTAQLVICRPVLPVRACGFLSPYLYP